MILLPASASASASDSYLIRLQTCTHDFPTAIFKCCSSNSTRVRVPFLAPCRVPVSHRLLVSMATIFAAFMLLDRKHRQLEAARERIAARDVDLAHKALNLAATRELVTARIVELGCKEREVSTKRELVAARDVDLMHKALDLASTRELVAARIVELGNKSHELSASRDELAARHECSDLSAAARAALAAREALLSVRAGAVEQRHSFAVARAAALDCKLDELVAKRQLVSGRALALAQRAADISARRILVVARAAALDCKLEELATKREFVASQAEALSQTSAALEAERCLVAGRCAALCRRVLKFSAASSWSLAGTARGAAAGNYSRAALDGDTSAAVDAGPLITTEDASHDSAAVRKRTARKSQADTARFECVALRATEVERARTVASRERAARRKALLARRGVAEAAREARLESIKAAGRPLGRIVAVADAWLAPRGGPAAVLSPASLASRVSVSVAGQPADMATMLRGPSPPTHPPPSPPLPTWGGLESAGSAL